MTKMVVPQEAAALPVVEKNGESNKAEVDIEGKDPLKDFTPSPQADPAVLKKALLKMDFLVVVPVSATLFLVPQICNAEHSRVSSPPCTQWSS